MDRLNLINQDTIIAYEREEDGKKICLIKNQDVASYIKHQITNNKLDNVFGFDLDCIVKTIDNTITFNECPYTSVETINETINNLIRYNNLPPEAKFLVNKYIFDHDKFRTIYPDNELKGPNIYSFEGLIYKFKEHGHYEHLDKDKHFFEKIESLPLDKETRYKVLKSFFEELYESFLHQHGNFFLKCENCFHEYERITYTVTQLKPGFLEEIQKLDMSIELPNPSNKRKIKM